MYMQHNKVLLFNYNNMLSINNIEYNESISHIKEKIIQKENETIEVLNKRKANVSFYFFATNHINLININIKKKIVTEASIYVPLKKFFGF